MLCVLVLNVIMLSAIMLSVVAARGSKITSIKNLLNLSFQVVCQYLKGNQFNKTFCSL
jgi:hypothetical protein